MLVSCCLISNVFTDRLAGRECKRQAADSETRLDSFGQPFKHCYA